MPTEVISENESIRKIEDIIDIQKANGNFSIRQVAFNLPPGTDSAESRSADLVQSLDSGLYKRKVPAGKKKFKKLRAHRQKSFLPDVISWPSDSDITVLRMKFRITNSDLKESVDNTVPGDGPHRWDSSSMVNLATLTLQNEQTSKHNFNIEEYLLPLTSWEQERDLETEVAKEFQSKAAKSQKIEHSSHFEHPNIYRAVCSHEKDFSLNDTSSDYSRTGAVSKLARFLRLYFCPCCTCLYKLENMQSNTSTYFTKNKDDKDI